MDFRYLPILCFFFSSLQGCAIHKPCSDAGDTTWNPKVVGDKRCGQKQTSDGKFVNDGSFTQYYQSNRRLALEGQFVDGLKQGIWTHYAEDGKLKAVKVFERGVEIMPNAEKQKEIDRMIQQKTGMK